MKTTKIATPIIDGKITNAPNLVVLQRLDSIPIDVDTVQIAPDGTFKSTRIGLTSDFYRLKVGSEEINLILDSDSTTHITFDYFNIQNSIAFSGYRQSEILQKVEHNTALFEQKILASCDTIKKLVGSSVADSIVEILYRNQDTLVMNFRNNLEQIMVGNEANLVAIPAFYQQAGNIALYSIAKDKQQFVETQFLLSQLYPQSYQVKRFSSLVFDVIAKVDGIRRMHIGDKLPDLEVFTPWNERLPLNSLTGKNVMVVIWSSELPICRLRNKSISKLMWRYHNQGLETYMISLETNSLKWQAAIKEDELNCLHVSDLRGQSSPVISLLGVESLPAIFLVNGEGNIVEMNIWGEKLEDAIQRLVKKKK